MKAITFAVLALVCVVGMVVADYGYGGGVSYLPVYGGGYGGGKGGFGDGGFLMLIGFLFIILFLFGGFNQTTGSSLTIVNATG